MGERYCENQSFGGRKTSFVRMMLLINIRGAGYRLQTDGAFRQIFYVDCVSNIAVLLFFVKVKKNITMLSTNRFKIGGHVGCPYAHFLQSRKSGHEKR